MIVYEVLLVVGAWFLFRIADQNRPAVILGLMEVFFLFDVIFNPEGMALIDGYRYALATLWVVAAVVRLMVLIRVFRLQTGVVVKIAASIAILAIAVMPQLLADSPIIKISKETLLLVSVCIGVGLMATIIHLRPVVKIDMELDSWGQTVLRRSLNATFVVWTLLYVYHLRRWIKLFDINLKWMHILPVC
ncbi:membrane protein, partial [Candidatus Magnetobacterium bavaricum]